MNYQEKAFAAGKIPGGFFKREGRPSENETLVSRLIDRPIRPLFPKNFKCETQVICTVLSHDMENNPDIVALIGASAALTISGVPFFGPIGAARVGYADGEYILNPTLAEMETSEMDLVVAGTSEGVLMVESEAKELSEDVMLGAVNFGHQHMQKAIEGIIELAEACAKDPRDLPEDAPETAEITATLETLRKDVEAAYAIADKTERQSAIGEVRTKALELAGEEADSVLVGGLMKALEGDVVRSSILKTGKRIDGRDTKTVRAIVSEAGILPRTHGSALFTRVVKHRHWLWRLWVQVRMSKSLTHWQAKAVHALCCIITSHHSQLVKLAALARLVAVKSVMVSWHGVRLIRFCRQRMNSLIQCVLYQK